MKKEKVITGMNFFAFALYAFLGLGMEIVLLMIENLIYGNEGGALTPVQNIIHWCVTSAVWLAFAYILARYAKKHYGFCIKGEKQRVPALHLVLAAVLAAVCVALNAWSWGTLKALGEFAGKELPQFVFQYIYYVFEVVLVLSVIAYGQKAGEMWFKKSMIPWGGILAGLSWGLVHALTKGKITAGLEAMLAAVLYGCIYLLVKKRAVYAYPLILLAFAL